VQGAADIGVLGRAVARLLDGRLGEADEALAGADHVGELGAAWAKMQADQLVDVVRMRAAFEHIGDQHRIVCRRKVNPGPRQRERIELDVVPDLEHRRVLQHRLEDA
jgi:hypothetical protein